MFDNNSAFDKITKDLTAHIRMNKSYLAWMTFLTVSLMICLYAYYLQLTRGLGVTGLRDIVSWGMYISTFVFFVASSLIGMLISAILGMIGMKWITPITRIAEILAVAFSAAVGSFLLFDILLKAQLPKGPMGF